MTGKACLQMFADFRPNTFHPSWAYRRTNSHPSPTEGARKPIFWLSRFETWLGWANFSYRMLSVLSGEPSAFAAAYLLCAFPIPVTDGAKTPQHKHVRRSRLTPQGNTDEGDDDENGWMTTWLLCRYPVWLTGIESFPVEYRLSLPVQMTDVPHVLTDTSYSDLMSYLFKKKISCYGTLLLVKWLLMPQYTSIPNFLSRPRSPVV